MLLSKLIHRFGRLIGMSLLALIPVLGQAQDIHISINDTSLIAGEEILVPVHTTNISKDSAVIAGEFEFDFNENIFDVIGVETSGTLLESTSFVNYFQGTDQFSFAAPDTISGSGVLMYLRVKANAEASYYEYDNLDIVDAMLNEGTPSVTTENGRISIKGVSISPRNNIQIVEGETQQFNLSGDVVEPITWWSTNTSVATIDANGLLTANTTGQVRIYAEDAQGLRDSTSYFRIQPSNLTDLTVSIPDTSARQTQMIDIPVMTSDVTGLQITSLELDISFSSNYLELQDVIHTGTLTEGWGSPATDINSGDVQIAAASTDTLEGAGILYFLRFYVKDQYTGSTNLELNKALFNEDLSSATENGSFQTISKPTIEVTPSQTALSIGQKVNFEVTGGDGAPPYTWTVDNASVATIDASTGELSGVTRGDVIVNAVDSEGFSSSDIPVRVNDFDAYLDTVGVIYPDSAVLSLKTADLASYGISSYETEVKYDTSKFAFSDVITTGTQSENFTIQVRDSADFVRIAMASVTTIGGTSPILKLQFNPKDAAMNEDSVGFHLQYLTFNEPGPSVPTTTARPGLVSVTRLNPPGQISLSTPVNNATNLDTALVFEWVEDAEADDYQIQVALDNQFNSLVFDSVTANTQLALSPFEFDSTYYWRVAGINAGGMGSWSSVYSFTTFDGLPEEVQLLTPGDGTTGVNISTNLIWNSAELAETYTLQLSTVSDFSNTLIDSSAIADTSLSVNLNYGTDYYWRVRAENAQGSSPNWSQEFSFTTQNAAPSTPVLVSPNDKAVGVDISTTLIWQNAAQADSFKVQLSTDSTFASVNIESTQGDTSLTVNSLAYETQYFWRVEALNAAGSSGWSNMFRFTTVEKSNASPIVQSKLGSVTIIEDFGDFTAAVLDTVFNDPEGLPLSYQIIRFDTTLFKASLNQDTLRLSSVANQFGNGEVILEAIDDESLTIRDTLHVNITEVNDLPVISGLSDTLRFRNDDTLSVDLSSAMSDIEDGLSQLTVSLNANPSDIIAEFDDNTFTVSLRAPGFSGEGDLTITVIDTDGGQAQITLIVDVEMSTSSEREAGIPDDFALYQNYPNPFNPSTQINFDLPEAAEVRIEVYSMLGQRVASLTNKRYSAGKHRIEFDAASLSSGMYIYRIQAGNFVQTKKMTLIK